MRISSDDNIKNFKEKFNIEIEFDKLKEVLSSPWFYLHQQFESEDYFKIRYKYFGVFVIYPKRIKELMKTNEEFFESGRRNEKQYLKMKRNLENHLKQNDECKV
jgi:hypothetical protein